MKKKKNSHATGSFPFFKKHTFYADDVAGTKTSTYAQVVVVVVVVVVDWDFTMLLTSQVISVAFYSEREKLDKFC